MVRLGRGDALVQHISWTAPIEKCSKGGLAAVSTYSPGKTLRKIAMVLLLRISLLVQWGPVCILCASSVSEPNLDKVNKSSILLFIPLSN